MCASTNVAEDDVQTDRQALQRVCLCISAQHSHCSAPRDLQVVGTLHEAFALLAFVCLCMMIRHAVAMCSSGIAVHLRRHLCWNCLIVAWCWLKVSVRVKCQDNLRV